MTHEWTERIIAALPISKQTRRGGNPLSYGDLVGATSRRLALAEFKRMMLWIALAGMIMVAASLYYISLFEPLRLHMVVATIMGVFFSVLLGSGLFAAAFFSDKSGHDQSVTDATRQPDHEGHLGVAA